MKSSSKISTLSAKIEQIIDDIDTGEGTLSKIPVAGSVYKTLKQFENSTGYLVSFESINLDFYNRLKDYMLKSLNHSINTFGKRIKTIKSIMNYATEIGINNNSREWWATELASKSRITSNLVNLLIQYVKCEKTIRNEVYDKLCNTFLTNEFGIYIYSEKEYDDLLNNSHDAFDQGGFNMSIDTKIIIKEVFDSTAIGTIDNSASLPWIQIREGDKLVLK